MGFELFDVDQACEQRRAALGVAGTKLDPGLLSRFEKVAQLPEEEKNAVLLLLDSVIAKHTIRKVMGS